MMENYRTLVPKIDFVEHMARSISGQILNSKNDEIIENYHRILAIALLKVDEALRAAR